MTELWMGRVRLLLACGRVQIRTIARATGGPPVGRSRDALLGHIGPPRSGFRRVAVSYTEIVCPAGEATARTVDEQLRADKKAAASPPA